LFSATALLLFLPKILGVLLLWVRGAGRWRGGRLGLAASMLCEFALPPMTRTHQGFSTPSRACRVLRWAAQWKSPAREDSETTWGQAARRHGWHTLLGVLWAGGVYWLNPSFLEWWLPVVGALMLRSRSVYTSRVSLGRGCARPACS
jgi:membrane glycosyltransferase